MSPAEMKIKAIVEANAHRFRHEGDDVIRWLTGGTDAPDAYVTFSHEGGETITSCPCCKQEMGRFAAESREASAQLTAIRLAWNRHVREQSTACRSCPDLLAVIV